MKPLLSAQELARRNKESVAVHAAYEKRRKLRRLLGKKSKHFAKTPDDLNWQAAEPEAKSVCAVGFFCLSATTEGLKTPNKFDG